MAQRFAIYGTQPNAVTGDELATEAVDEKHLAPAVRLRAAELVLDGRAPSTTEGTGVVLGTGDEELVQAQAVPDMTVQVATPGIAYNHLGQRIVGTAAAAVAIDAADPANPRWDVVVLLPAGSKAVRKGAPAASPADPALQAGDVPLARVVVAAAATEIGAGAITDLRERKGLRGDKMAPGTLPGSVLEDGAVDDAKRAGAFQPTLTQQTVGAATADVARAGFGPGEPASTSAGVRCEVVGTTAAGATCAFSLFAAFKKAANGDVARIGDTAVVASAKDAALATASADLVAGEGALAGFVVVRATGVANETVTWAVSGRAVPLGW